jgi:4-amino-4-deoxy-L-arabinose transferase-like glycosyltransferase
MNSNISYLLLHYAYFSVFLCAFFGIGHHLLIRVFELEVHDTILGATLATALGQGVFIFLLQCLAVGGVMNSIWVSFILVSFCLLAYWEISSVSFTPFTKLLRTWSGVIRSEFLCLVFLFIFAFPTLLEPLRPPWPGDELMYHLPHAQQWALTGKLTINEWLRYPWFPYNYNLLYAAAIVIYGDVFTHLFNALAGCLIAIMIYRLGKLYFTNVVACVATFFWFQMNRREFGKTNVDMGTTLYALAGSFTFFWWMQAPNDRRWLVVSSFLIGVAVGTKYQALFFLPLFGLAIIWTDRRISTLLIATISLLTPCVYWYARNAVFTGDPFNPIGGKFFGFTDWSIVDYEAQFEDLKRVSSWPVNLIWPAVFALWHLRWPKNPIHFYAVVLCSYFFIVWMVTSHYPRYLMPVVPWLTLLAAENWSYAFKFVSLRMSAFITPSISKILKNFMWILIFIAATLSCVSFSKTYWQYISPSQEKRDILMRQELKGYAVLEYANQHHLGRIYNVALGDAVYYAPSPIWGDTFGPWRYADVISDDPLKFSNELRKRNFDSVIVPQDMSLALESSSFFSENFSILFQSDGIKVYRVEKINHE